MAALTLLSIASWMVAALDVGGVREEMDHKHFTMSEAEPKTMHLGPAPGYSNLTAEPPERLNASLEQQTSLVATRVDQGVVLKLGMAALTRVFGFFFAVLIEYVLWSLCFKGQKRTTFTEAPAEEMTGDFKPIGLFACFSMQLKGILEWLCCFGFMWSDTAIGSGAITENGLILLIMGLVGLDFLGVGILVALLEVGFNEETAEALFGIYEILTLLILFRCVFNVRRAMREKQPGGNESASAAVDAGHVICCCPCTVQQQTQYQEISTLVKYPNLVESPKLEEEKPPTQSTLQEAPALEQEEPEAPALEQEKPEVPTLEEEKPEVPLLEEEKPKGK